MKEIPKWLRAVRTVFNLILCLILLALVVILLIVFSNPVDFGAEWANTLFGLLLAIGGVILVSDVLANPFFLCFVGLVVTANVLYYTCRGQIAAHGETTLSAKGLRRLFCGIMLGLCAVCVLLGWRTIAAGPYNLCGRRLIQQADAVFRLNDEPMLRLKENPVRESGGIFDEPAVEYDSLLVDFDKPRVSAVYTVYSDADGKYVSRWWSIPLRKTDADSDIFRHITADYLSEAAIPLEAPNTELRSYFDPVNTVFTQAFILETETGIYCADNVPAKASGDFSEEVLPVWSEYFDFNGGDARVLAAAWDKLTQKYGEPQRGSHIINPSPQAIHY